VNRYLLISGVKRPSEVRSQLAVSMVDVARISDVPPDSVRVDLLDGIDLADESDLKHIVGLIMQGLSTCGESDAQMGVFTDGSSNDAA
jgi:hypothetical protein